MSSSVTRVSVATLIGCVKTGTFSFRSVLNNTYSNTAVCGRARIAVLQFTSWAVDKPLCRPILHRVAR